MVNLCLKNRTKEAREIEIKLEELETEDQIL